MTDIGWWRWNGAMLLPTRLEAVERMFEVDGRYHLESHFERSAPRHRAYFASLAEAWHSLPESTRDELPSPEHLRHFSLIKTGWRNERHIVLGSHREAIRVAAFMARPETFAVIFPDGHRVVEWTAKSQSYRAMDREAFNRSMDDVMRYVAGLIGVSQEELEEQGASA